MFQRRPQGKDANGNKMKVKLDHLSLPIINNLAESPGRGIEDKQRKLARKPKLESHSLKGEISGDAYITVV